jgi:hypothetical protein
MHYFIQSGRDDRTIKHTQDGKVQRFKTWAAAEGVARSMAKSSKWDWVEVVDLRLAA